MNRLNMSTSISVEALVESELSKTWQCYADLNNFKAYCESVD